MSKTLFPVAEVPRNGVYKKSVIFNYLLGNHSLLLSFYS